MNIQLLHRVGATAAVVAAGFGLGACGSLLDVEFPGQIPAENINNPSLAPVLARSVIGDLECAYNNYSAGNAAHSDEYESSNGNVPGVNWGSRAISAGEDDYALGACENTSYFGMPGTLGTARYQAEDIFAKLSAWTDAEVSGRTNLMAQVRAYGAYSYLLMGETFCQVAFDGKAPEAPAAALAKAEAQFAEAITLATTAGNTDMVNMARVGLARAKMDLKKWSEAATAAALVPVGYEKMADRGAETSRRYNKFYFFMTDGGYFTVATELRATANPQSPSYDPRYDIADAGKGAFTPQIRLWYTKKYPSLGTPIRLASGREAQLILAEAKTYPGSQLDVAGALAILNGRRGQLGLSLIPASTDPVVVRNAVIRERRAELSFEGGHRTNDLLRYALPWKGANGSTKITNEFDGRAYGAPTCWPLPTKEANGA